jgi:hypothetical protein
MQTCDLLAVIFRQVFRSRLEYAKHKTGPSRVQQGVQAPSTIYLPRKLDDLSHGYLRLSWCGR